MQQPALAYSAQTAISPLSFPYQALAGTERAGHTACRSYRRSWQVENLPNLAMERGGDG
jgi:hypothetical protein